MFWVFGVKVCLFMLVIIVSVIVMMIFFDWLVNWMKLGCGIWVVVEDVLIVVFMGIDIDKMILCMFVIGGVLVGVVGFLFGMVFGVSNLMGFILGVKVFVVVVFGGIGNICGVMIGGFIFG